MANITLLFRCVFTAILIVASVGMSMIGADCWAYYVQQTVRLGMDSPWRTIASFVTLVLSWPAFAAMWVSAWVHGR